MAHTRSSLARTTTSWPGAASTPSCTAFRRRRTAEDQLFRIAQAKQSELRHYRDIARLHEYEAMVVKDLVVLGLALDILINGACQHRRIVRRIIVVAHEWTEGHIHLANRNFIVAERRDRLHSNA